ncbi:MAG: diguanylate cyclase [Comamonas sp.]
MSRPEGFLAAFWPANALLLGALLRWPSLAGRGSWLIAAVVMVLADLLTGSSALSALWLSGANLLGVACGWWFLRRLDAPILQLRRQGSVLYVLTGSLLAAAGSTLVGTGACMYLFGDSWTQTSLMWFSTELMNYMLILPVVLSVPTGHPRHWWPELEPRAALLRLLPLLAVLVSECAAVALGGPGAMTFTVPALLWCALSYRLFNTALLSLLVCSWKIVTISMDVIEFTPDNLEMALSLRLGLMLLSLGPLAVACTQIARNELLNRLNRAASHDSLTDVLTRGAFMGQGQRLLERLQHEGRPAAVLMLDLDHFKRVNDLHGHAAGDALLRAFAKTVGRVLRPQDLLGRVGGEEFAVLLPNVRPSIAEQIASRICTAVRAQRLALPSGKVLQVTVSIGLACSDDQSPALDALLQRADGALYQTKAAGRDAWQRSPASELRPALASALHV